MCLEYTGKGLCHSNFNKNKNLLSKYRPPAQNTEYTRLSELVFGSDRIIFTLRN